MYSEDEIERQLRLGEDSQWEFKRIEFSGDRPVSPNRSDLADEIAAFANADGGVLFCGASDSGELQQDMSFEQLTALDSLLVEVSTDSIKPPVRIETHHRKLPTGARVLLVRIPNGDSQYDSPGGSFVRVGGSKRRMLSDEKLRLAQKRSQGRYLWFDKQAWPNTGIGTLDKVALEAADERGGGCRARNSSRESWPSWRPTNPVFSGQRRRGSCCAPAHPNCFSPTPASRPPAIGVGTGHPVRSTRRFNGAQRQRRAGAVSLRRQRDRSGRPFPLRFASQVGSSSSLMNS